MLALIEIPHRRSAKINWYDDVDALIADAVDQSAATDREEPTDLQSAVQTLSDDWYSHVLVQSAADLETIRSYGHQKRAVRAMLNELTAEILAATTAALVCEMRHHANLTQAELAAKLGVDTMRISDLEAGRRPNIGLHTMSCMADACGVAVAYSATTGWQVLPERTKR